MSAAVRSRARRFSGESQLVLEMVIAGGIVMLPLLACSVVALAIVIERFWTLQRKRVVPDNLVAQVWQWAQAGTLDDRRVQALKSGSPLGRVLAAGLAHRHTDRQSMKEGIEEVGRHVVFDGSLRQCARHHRVHRAAAGTARHGDGHDSNLFRRHQAGRQ